MNKKLSLFTIGVVTLATLLLHSLPVTAEDAPSTDADAGFDLICLTEQPVIFEGGSATLKAWASTFDGGPITTPIKFEWEVDAGLIDVQVAGARWDLSTVQVASQEEVRKVIATVKATQVDHGEQRCMVEVIIGKKVEANSLRTPGVRVQEGTNREAQRLSVEVVDLYRQGRYKEAIPIAQRELAISEKALGPKHQDTATALNNLGEIYRATGAYAKAKPFNHRAFEIREKALGPKHQDKGTTRGENLISAKRFLLPGDVEVPGYGLYSYVLFSAPPKDAEERARYLKTIEAYLLVLQDVDDYLRHNVRPRSLNATYIPLKEVPAPGKSNAEFAVNVLAVYDYTAAEILMNNVRHAHQQGPYLLSVLKPLSAPGEPPHLWEDLTGVVPDEAWNWIKFFTYLAAQQRSWSEDSLRRFGLKLRNLIAVGGKVTPDVLKGLEKAIQFKPKM